MLVVALDLPCMGRADHSAGADVDEDQGGGAAGAQVLSLDRRLHPGIAVHVPADVDRQVRVRRVGAVHRAPQVLLGVDVPLHSSSSETVAGCMPPSRREGEVG